MITLAGTQSAEEMTAALVANGQEVSAPAPAAPEKATVVEGKKSESKPTSPEVKPGGSEDKTAPVVTEAGEKKPQETQAAPPVEVIPPAEPKPGEPGKKFEPQLERRKDLERKVTRLHEDLDLERGSKAAIQSRLETAERELAALKPKEPEAKKDDEPAEPTFPLKKDFDYDDEKHEAALVQYQKDMKVYNKAVTDKALREDRAAAAEERKQEAIKAENKRFHDELAGRVQKSIKDFELSDFDALVEQLTAEETGAITPGLAAENYIEHKSKNPGLLIHYFMKDHLEGEGREIARLAAMDPIDQVFEVKAIEDRLIAERANKSVPVVEDKPVVASPAAAAPPEQPAKPKPVAKPDTDEPLDTVGARAGARAPSLADAEGKGALAYARLRGAGVNR